MNPSFVLIMGLLLRFGLTSPSLALAADWPQWRGPNRDGHVKADVTLNAETQIEILWKAEIGVGFSSIAVADGNVYSIGHQDEQDIIWCLDQQNGKVRWKHPYPAKLDPNLFEGGPTATPTLAAGRLFAVSRSGLIHCLNAATGDVVWKREAGLKYQGNAPEWGYAGSPLVLPEGVIFNIGSHGLCLDPEMGEVVWESNAEERAGYTSPVLAPTASGPLVLLESEKTLNAVDPANGEVRWSYRWITRYGINAADPLLVGENRVLLSSGYGKGTSLIEFDADGAEPLWRVRDMKNQLSPGVQRGNALYAVDGDAGRQVRLVCLDIPTGKINWQVSGYGSSSLIAVNDTLLILSEKGDLLIAEAEPDKFSLLAELPLLDGKCWTPIAYSDSMVFARNATGTLVGARLKQP